MGTLSMIISSSLPLQNQSITQKSSFSRPTHHLLPKSLQLLKKHSNHLQTLTKTHLSFTILDLFTSRPCFASESVVTDPVSEKIDLEAILISIDDFFNKYPFFVAGCTFIWLVVWPITEYYLSKCKYIYTIDAFNKLRDDPNAQLVDIRPSKTTVSLGSPNLRYLSKSVLQVEFDENNEDGFLKTVLNSFPDPANTIVCILDNFDGDSLKVAELLYKSGFKEAYAIKDGVRGKKGWLVTQENLLPPAVHILPNKKKKKGKTVKQLKINGVGQQNEDNNDGLKSGNALAAQDQTKDITNVNETMHVKVNSRSSSPFPNYPDLKPPSSPTPSKPS